jgi:hypothetical protein
MSQTAIAFQTSLGKLRDEGAILAGVCALHEVLGSKIMEEAYPATNRDAGFAETLAAGDQEVLDRAIVKLALLGKQVGVDPDRMIELLDSGLTVGELLLYLALCNDGHV